MSTDDDLTSPVSYAQLTAERHSDDSSEDYSDDGLFSEPDDESIHCFDGTSVPCMSEGTNDIFTLAALHGMTLYQFPEEFSKDANAIDDDMQGFHHASAGYVDCNMYFPSSPNLLSSEFERAFADLSPMSEDSFASCGHSYNSGTYFDANGQSRGIAEAPVSFISSSPSMSIFSLPGLEDFACDDSDETYTITDVMDVDAPLCEAGVSRPQKTTMISQRCVSLKNSTINRRKRRSERGVSALDAQARYLKVSPLPYLIPNRAQRNRRRSGFRWS